jgi:type IV secretion system protein VirD4
MAYNPTPSNTARIATTLENCAGGLLDVSGIRLGFDQQTGLALRFKGEGNVLTCAGPRTGKLTTILAPAILDTGLDGHSLILVDPKGEIACITKRHRESLGPVYVLNPFGVEAERLGPSARYNPMSFLNPDDTDNFCFDCESLSEAIVSPEPGEAKHFADTARQLVAGVIGQLRSVYPEDAQNLSMLRDIITGAVPPMNAYEFAKEALGTAEDQSVLQKLGRFAQPHAEESREITSHISTAETQTAFIQGAIAKNLSGASSFDFRDLKKGVATVYIVLPEGRLTTCAKWFRLIIASALNSLLRSGRGAVPVMMILDEFYLLGNLSHVQRCLSVSAGLGLQFWPVLQDLTQLKDLYGEGWQSFLSAADVRQFFGTSDMFTARTISELSGVGEIITETKNVSMSLEVNREPSIAMGYGQKDRHVLEPYETMRLGPDESLISAPRIVHNIIRAKRAAYFDAQAYPEFHPDGEPPLYDANPYAKHKAADVVKLGVAV